MLLVIDPGDKTNGWAKFDLATGAVHGFGEVKGRDNLLKFLRGDEDTTKLLIEEFKLFGHKAKQQSGSAMETTRVIGMVETWAAMSPRPIELLKKQPSSILPIAQMWSQKKVPASGSTGHDMWSAYNHGYYYLVQQKVLKPKVAQ